VNQGTPSPAEDSRQARAGLIYGLSAYTLWGVFPLYFRALAQVSPWVILSHRVVWSVLFLALLVTGRKEWGAVTPVVRSPRGLVLLAAGAVLIAVNWLIFIYAVVTNQLLQASLGYFINPLLSVALGVLFLGERLRKWQWVAVGIAAVAVANMALRGGRFPWIALSLAASFALYGLVRKKVNINSLHGLLVETAILLPASLVFWWLMPSREYPPTTWILLSLAGVITATPLLFFGAAVRRLKLSTIGFLQYIGPTLQFLLAILIFGEHLDPAKLVSFAVCWAAIGVYVADSLRRPPDTFIADEPE
jgi:chloramphenicol-sensitive protein RarD